MKRMFIALMIIILCGCGKNNYQEVVNKFTKKVTKSDSYLLKANMSIISEEDTYEYDVKVEYKEENNYKVTLINKINNHEQIILRNDEGVYVVTPSLNKSFKFQSEWPYNSSQAYIPNTLVNDLKLTKDKEIEKIDNYLIVKSNVEYPNNDTITYQKLYFDKNDNLSKVIVYDKNNKEKIIVKFTSIDFNKKIDDNIFKLESNLDENCCDTEKTTSKIDSIIYPLYIPNETFLQTKETINTDNGIRNILSFTGSKSFILVEENVSSSKEHELIPVYGDPLIINDSIGALSSTSLTWRSNDVEYYLTSNDLNEKEMISIAESVSNNASISVGK